MKLDTNVEISPNVLLQEVDDETILLNMESEEYFSLNEIGTIFYELLQEHKNLEVVLQELQNHFDAPKEQLERDLTAFVKTLEEKGLLN